VVEPGGEYLIRVSGFNGSEGSFVLNIYEAGVVTGTVRDEATLEPLTQISILLYDENDWWRSSTTTDASGRYILTVPGSGSHFARTYHRGEHLDELYDDIPCPKVPGHYCDFTTGTPIPIIPGKVTSDIDFDLGHGGVITGSIKDAAGVPLAGATVTASGPSATGHASTDAAGVYRVAGLISGAYSVVAEHSQHCDELYRNQPCLGGAGLGCDPESGTRVMVTTGETTDSINFRLDRRAAIQGMVTTVDGRPVADARIEIWSDDGALVKSGYTGADGSYSIGGLSAGTYFVIAADWQYIDQLYSDIPCEGGCDATTGNRVVLLTDSSTVNRIDLVLTAAAMISGTVTESATGNPIADSKVELYDSSGAYLDTAMTDSSGAYLFTSLADGAYYAVTKTWDPPWWSWGEKPMYIDEVYDDLPYDHECPVEHGTVIVTGTGAPASGIDMALDFYGAISGRLTDSATGEPIPYTWVWASGNSSGTIYTDEDGFYTITKLHDGDYMVRTDSHSHVNEVYDDVACVSGLSLWCPVGHTPVSVSRNTITSGVDFALDRGATLTGSLTDAITGKPVTEGRITVWSSIGRKVMEAKAQRDGQWTAEGLPAGTYFVTVTDLFAAGYGDALHDGFSCDDGTRYGCDPTDGTPITVALGATATGIDFRLQPLGKISGWVRDAVNGNPAPNAWVAARDSSGRYRGGTHAFSSGAYLIDQLVPGDYYIVAGATGLAGEVFDDVPCVGWGCDFRAGAPVKATLGAVTPNINFALEQAQTGAVSGTVSDALTGNPLVARIELWSTDDTLVGSTSSQPSGFYLLPSVPEGVYYVTTSAGSGYLDQLHSGLPCLHGPPQGCTPSKGAPVVVTTDTVTTGVDFTLTYLDTAILTTVTAGDSGAPLPGVRIDIWDASDSQLVTSAETGNGGTCLALVPPGTYRISTFNTLGYLDEVYMNLICKLGSAALGDCDVTAGLAVEVMSGVTSDIEFALSAKIFVDGFESGDTKSWSEETANGGT
jgi:protocatechuate 3,4-dioxygenase beta subunit